MEQIISRIAVTKSVNKDVNKLRYDLGFVRNNDVIEKLIKDYKKRKKK